MNKAPILSGEQENQPINDMEKLLIVAVDAQGPIR
jgi:hypothetical protein